MITYIKGNLFDHIKKDETNIILHICNDRGGWGSGFVMAINKYLGVKPMNSYRSLKHYNLGEIDIVEVSPTVYVINMIAQSTPGGTSFTINNKTIYCPPFRPDSFRECLYRVLEKYQNQKVNIISPLMGCGLAGSNKKTVFDIVNDVFKDMLDITVYEI